MASTDPTAMVGLMPAPPGVVPDFYHTTSVQISFITVFAVTFALATIALILRVYTRAFIVKSLGLDEPLLIASWAMTLAFFVESVKAMPAGFGRNMYEVTGLQLVGYLERLLTLAYTYIWPPTLTKLSILILYWRISPNTVFRACIVAIAVVVVGYSITFTVLFAGPCNPLLGTPESALCLNKIAVSQAVLNIVTDGMIILLPIPTIHALNMPLKQRITVGCILGLGSAACIASIIRVAYVRAMVDNPDFTFTQASAAVWSLLEMNLGILCNSLAALKPFVRRHMPSFLSKTDSGAGASGEYAKRSKSKGTGGGSHGRWGHSYQLHSVGNEKKGASTTTSASGKGGEEDIVVVDQFSVEWGNRAGNATPTTMRTGKADSTDSILAIQFPGHQAV